MPRGRASAVRSLVTGGTGFLGSAVARRLHERGDEVVVLLRPTSDRSRLAAVPYTERIGDVTDRASVDAAFEGVDRVFHCAAYVEFGPADHVRLTHINVTGTANVLGAAADRSVAAVHVSSGAALGPTGETVRDEQWWNPTEPRVAYERTKRAAHLVARELAADGAPVRVVSPGGIYGPGDDSELGVAIRAYQRYPIPFGYVPGVMHSTVHVDDCAEVIVRASEQGGPGAEYVAAAEAVTMREWFEAIASGARRRPPRWYLGAGGIEGMAGAVDRTARMVGRRADRFSDTAHMLTRSLAFSGGKARRELGWEPRSLADGMRELGVANGRR